jgi:MSHA pilin protein MshD
MCYNPILTYSTKNTNGFTLIEVIIGIVVFAFSLSIITSLILPTSIQSANQVQQIRAAELGQSLMNEIIGKSFDENSDRVGGVTRCNEPSAIVNPCSLVFGPDADELSRADYDDVDDYNGLIESGSNIKNMQGQTLDRHYQGFTTQVSVVYDGNYDGLSDGNQNAKLITITVTSPAKDSIVFSSYKANF